MLFKVADSEVAPDAGNGPVLRDVGSDRGADNQSLEGPILSDAEEGGFSSKGGFLVEWIFEIIFDFFSFQTLAGWLLLRLGLKPLVWIKVVLRVLVEKTFRYV